MVPITGQVSSCFALALSILLSSLAHLHLHFLVFFSPSSQALILTPYLTRLLMLYLFSWSSVSDDLFFSSCSFLVLLLALSFSRLILSLSFFCSSVSEALFALSFSFLSEYFFRLLLCPAKAALAYRIIRVSQVGFNCPKLTLSMRVFGPCNSTHVFWHTYFL